MSKSIFITGTDTDVGKTFVTAHLIKALRDKGIQAGYYKAALSGAYYEEGKLIPGDAKYVMDIADFKEDYDKCVSYTFETAVSPHLAAQIEGIEVNLDKIKVDYKALLNKHEYLFVEGSGGIICPIQATEKAFILLEDIIKRLDLDILVVARAGLGTINHTVLTVKYIQSQGLAVKGIILNGYEEGNTLHEDNKRMIEALTGVEVIAVIPSATEENVGINLDAEKLMSLCK